MLIVIPSKYLVTVRTNKKDHLFLHDFNYYYYYQNNQNQNYRVPMQACHGVLLRSPGAIQEQFGYCFIKFRCM